MASTPPHTIFLPGDADAIAALLHNQLDGQCVKVMGDPPYNGDKYGASWVGAPTLIVASGPECVHVACLGGPYFQLTTKADNPTVIHIVTIGDRLHILLCKGTAAVLQIEVKGPAEPANVGPGSPVAISAARFSAN